MSQNDEIVGLAKGVQSRLAGQVHGFQLLETCDGLVLLGRTSTYYAKQLAQHAVMDATDLPILANKIEVESDAFPKG